MARPRDDDADRRILAAARELLSERGPACVTIDEIAARAAVAKTTIYRRWDSRTALVLDALVELVEPTRRTETGTTKQRLTAQLQRLAAVLTSTTGQMIRELVALAQGDESIASEFRTRFLAPRRTVPLDTLRHGQAHGEIRTDLDPETLLDLLTGPLWQRFLLGHAPITPKAVASLVDAMWSAIERDHG